MRTFSFRGISQSICFFFPDTINHESRDEYPQRSVFVSTKSFRKKYNGGQYFPRIFSPFPSRDTYRPLIIILLIYVIHSTNIRHLSRGRSAFYPQSRCAVRPRRPRPHSSNHKSQQRYRGIILRIANSLGYLQFARPLRPGVLFVVDSSAHRPRATIRRNGEFRHTTALSPSPSPAPSSSGA